MKTKLLKFIRRPVVILTSVGVCILLLVGVDLFAQDNPTSRHLSPPESIEMPSSSTAAADAAALLPTIPQATDTPLLGPLPKDVSPTAPVMPGMPVPDPDAFKNLYGYSGPYYNTTDLDNRVAVLDSSVNIWPSASWKATGLLRNQTGKSVHIRSLTVRLLGSDGKVIATVSAQLPLDDLRPGEPGPFMIQTAVPSVYVKSYSWQVENDPVQDGPRSIVLGIDESGIFNGTDYLLFGSLRNAATTTAEGVGVIAAWLDKQGKVLYVASPKIRLQSDPTKTLDSMNLPAGDEEDFIFTTNDMALASSLVRANDAILWGVSK
jgi:hypothetical protein